MTKQVKDIIVNNPETVKPNNLKRMTETIDLSKLSKAELKAALERKEAEEKAVKQKALNEYKAEKEQFIKNTVESFKALSGTLRELKKEVITKGNDLYNKMYLVHDKEPKEVNQFTLKTEDDQLKVVIERHEKFEFTEDAQVAINGIKEFFRNKFESRSKLVYSLLDELLIKNSKGDYDPKLLTKLRKKIYEINDEQLHKDFELLEQSQRVVGTALYCRAYEKDNKGKWKDIVIQFSSL